MIVSPLSLIICPHMCYCIMNDAIKYMTALPRNRPPPQRLPRTKPRNGLAHHLPRNRRHHPTHPPSHPLGSRGLGPQTGDTLTIQGFPAFRLSQAISGLGVSKHEAISGFPAFRLFRTLGRALCMWCRTPCEPRLERCPAFRLTQASSGLGVSRHEANTGCPAFRLVRTLGRDPCVWCMRVSA